MHKQMYVLKTGREIRIERGWRRQSYRPGLFSLKRCIRLLLRYQDGRKVSKLKKFHASSTTGGWELFDASPSVAPFCDCAWHRKHRLELSRQDPNYRSE